MAQVQEVDEWKSQCITQIWGFTQPQPLTDHWRNRIGWLQSYFDNYLTELVPDVADSPTHPTLNPTGTRETLKQKALGEEANAYIAPSADTDDKKQRNFNRSLAAACRALFGISIHHAPQFAEGEVQIKQTQCLWREDATIQALLEREFPTSEASEQLSGRFRERLISLRSLVRHADITVVWTHHLPDHLLLSYGETRKTLAVFELPSMIEVSYEACKDVTINDANKNTCHGRKGDTFSFSREFMLETLQTYRLLIPNADSEWAGRTFIRSGKPFWSWIRFPFSNQKKHQQTKDRRLTATFNLGYQSRLTTHSQMFKQYPHWGLRLQTLMAEAEDPMPLSATGRWAERRKGPRHSFWVTVVAFVVASIFGIVATALAVVQFWVAWCDWQKDTSPPQCNPRGLPKEPGASTSSAAATTTAG
ncbi:hypothetical protein B0H63DRAFT_507561 [Podospora didyma]|uniref:Uncharacterized protein n=1 Tax=Podospora didyma TaxID=330526 RepID=A0AAE0NZC3_9PEZI|nr:hypothetical protein B0H63DRAFT_507561 [Podospora didyma]